ncbi:MAG: FAD-dependent monooxygenase [Phycisphaerales bacterium]|nr:FAD-dependent monooxygenase [Phycisphaerales bacterium]
MMSTENIPDLVILGAGPAGTAAAAFAAGKSLNVELLDQNQAPATLPLIEWLPAGADHLLEKLKVNRDEHVVGAVDTVRFIDAKNSRTAKTKLKPPVDLVLTHRLLEQLRSMAGERGAVVSAGTRIVSIDPREEKVHLVSATDQEFTGRLLVAADGTESWAAKKLGIYPKTQSRHSMSCQWASLGADLPKKTGQKPSAELSLLFTSDSLADFSYVYHAGDITLVGLITEAPPDRVESKFQFTVDWGKDDGVLPSDLVIDPGNLVHRTIPRGLALDMETHGAKRSLVIGDAGGFIPALSHDGLYPAIWSAELAVETCVSALDSPHPQDALSEFDHRWRRDMVEYLRLPNVDLRFLLPLVFSNEQMAQKVARAFVYGENL